MPAQGIANLVFFIPYVLFQPPSTILVRRIGPRLHLAGILFGWGAAMVGMGFVSNFSQLAGLRVVGALEAGFFPSCVYLLSTWYTRCESPGLTLGAPGSLTIRRQTTSASATRSFTCSAASPRPAPASWPLALVPPRRPRVLAPSR